MKTAICQFAATYDADANLQSCIKFIDEAGDAAADLVVLPEASMYFDPHHERSVGGDSQSVDGMFSNALADAARKAGVTVVAGMTESIDGDRRDSNTLIAISPKGEIIGVYRKLHLYDAFGYRESDEIRPGEWDKPLVFDVGGVSVGALTCYDLRFPEAFRWVVDAGAEMVVLPAAWAAGALKEDHWVTLLKARAIENTVYVAAAGQTGPISCGLSMVIDPMGVTIRSAGEKPGFVIADVTRERIATVRELNPSLSNRRFKTMPR